MDTVKKQYAEESLREGRFNKDAQQIRALSFLWAAVVR
jgi:hypothetical protein